MILTRGDNNLAARVRNHDLYWVEQAGDWNKPELLSSNLAQRVSRKHFTLTNYSTIQVVSMPIPTVGGPGGGGWLLWANGYVAQDISVNQAGTYCFNVSASGTMALGGWPRLVLQIDGRTEDLVTVATNDPPKVSQGQSVRLERLQAMPWVQNGTNAVKVAYRAAAVIPTTSAAKPAPAPSGS